MPLNDKEQELLEVHLSYELDILDYAFVIAATKAEGAEESLHRLMAMDAFYIHARNLIEFFHGSSVDGRTAVARRFTKEGDFNYHNFDEYKEIINDQVAHLNLARGTNASRTIDGEVLAQIRDKLNVCLNRFQCNLTKDAHQHWQRRQTKNYAITDDSQDSACTVIYETLTNNYDVSDTIDNIYYKANTG
jgi:hypothetical protein